MNEGSCGTSRTTTSAGRTPPANRTMAIPRPSPSCGRPMTSGRARCSGPTVELLTAGEPAWDDHLDIAERDIYHLAGYHSYAEGSGEGEAMLIVVGDRERGLAWPYLRRRIDTVDGLAGTDATDVTSVYGYPGPIVWGCRPGDAFLAAAWQEILEVWRQQRVVSVFTRFHPLLGNAAIVAARRAGLVTEVDEDWSEIETFTRLYGETMERSGAGAEYMMGLADVHRLRAALGGRL